MARPEIRITAYDLSAEQLEILIRVEDPTFFTNHGIDHHTPGSPIACTGTMFV